MSTIAIPVLKIICSIVLARSDNFFDGRVQTALETIDQVLYIRLKMEWVFSRGFLSSSPSRVSIGVDVRSVSYISR